MKNSVLTVSLLLVMFAGCATRSTVGQIPSKSASASASATSNGDLQTVIQGLGAPVQFDQVFAEVQGVPRFKDEFETTAQFEQRQAEARAKCEEHYLIATPVDPKYIRYDADKQVLFVSIYALSNYSTTDDELHALFGILRELKNANVDIEYSIIKNVEWKFPSEWRNVGTYVGQNAFGVSFTINKQEKTSRGIFERTGVKPWAREEERENVWFRGQPKYEEGSTPVAYEIKADPDRARALKQTGGLRAGVLVAPRFPFYATGVDRFTPTTRAPYDRTTNLRYLIGDIQCVAIYDSEGKLLATRPTQ